MQDHPIYFPEKRCWYFFSRPKVSQLLVDLKDKPFVIVDMSGRQIVKLETH